MYILAFHQSYLLNINKSNVRSNNIIKKIINTEKREINKEILERLLKV
jgi:hypothetical protein